MPKIGLLISGEIPYVDTTFLALAKGWICREKIFFDAKFKKLALGQPFPMPIYFSVKRGLPFSAPIWFGIGKSFKILHIFLTALGYPSFPGAL